MNQRTNQGSVAFVCAALAALSAGCVAGGADESDGERVAEGESAVGITYKVGPSRQYKTLGQVAGMLAPGDVVEIDGDASYAGGVTLSKSGTAASKITIRGVRVNGKRPVFSGGTNTIDAGGSHFVYEGLDIKGGSSRCFFHRADDITLRDSVVHDCPAHGILGADAGSGSLTLDYVEVYACGSGTTKHPIYVATDETAHPGSVFRMQHCYVHDANGGNNVKSRAERNEIYYNWIEGGTYKEIELIGPDGQSPGLKREDSDVVGNVFRKTQTQYVVRVGGDGTGDTNGRYRFVNNTFLLKQGSAAAFHLFDGIQSIEIHNNVFYRVGGGSVTIFQDDASWTSGSAVIAGTNNFVPTGTSVPAQWKGTIVKSDPGFVDVASRDVRLLSTSPLVDAGVNVTASPAGYTFPSPLALPTLLPPRGKIEAVGTAAARPVVGTIDIGAFEYGAANAPPPPPANGCVSSAWQNTTFASKTGTFTAALDVTPSAAGVDGGVGLALGPQSAWTGLAAIVRFNPNGAIDVRNGSAYGALVSLPYTAGKAYHLRVVVDVTNHKYAVYVTPAGASEVLLAQGYAFRTEQAAVASLDRWIVTNTAAGSLSACNFTLQ